MARPKGYRMTDTSRARTRATIASRRHNFVGRPQRQANPAPAKKLLELLQRAFLTEETI